MDYRNDSHSTLNFNRIFFAALMFMAAYLTTITVNAQTVVSTPTSTTVTGGDAISLGEGDQTVITGQIVDADENWVVVNSAGKDMKIVLDDVNLKAEADDVFEKGMQVTVTGEMKGDDFGTPLMKAKSITATEAGLVTVTP